MSSGQNPMTSATGWKPMGPAVKSTYKKLDSSWIRGRKL